MNEWISARDRTPEPGKTVLCYYQYEISGMKHFNFMFGCYVEGEGWHRVCTSGYHYGTVCFFTCSNAGLAKQKQRSFVE